MYRGDIDGLRALAVIPVILFHAGFEIFSGGFIGVDVFFVISGYLITTLIISDLDEGSFSIAEFYERRARRILPALSLVVGVCLPFAWFWFAPSDLKLFGQSLFAVSTFWSNILFWRKSGYFESASELNPMLHTWSLAVEEQFYLLFPVFLLLVWRFGSRWLITILLLILVVSLAVAHYAAYTRPSAAFYLLPTRGWELLIGALAAFLLHYYGRLESKILNQWASWTGFLLILYSIFVFDGSTPTPSFYTLIPTIGTFLIIVASIEGTVVSQILSARPIVAVGLISYSAYLWHQPMLAFSRYKYPNHMDDSVLIGICVCALILAWFSWRFVEVPFRNRSRFTSSNIFSGCLVISIFFAGLGIWLNQSDGRLQAHSPEDQKIFSSFVNPNAYLVKRHREIDLKRFSDGGHKTKILIAGDSHSEDLVNAVFEAGLSASFDFSSYRISGLCGVLFVDVKAKREHDRLPCPNWRNFDDRFFELARAADEVWIIASWAPIDVDYMQESISNLAMLNEEIVVFGDKDFGKIHAGIYKNTDPDEWAIGIGRLPKTGGVQGTRERNSLLSKEVAEAGGRFIDTQFLLCGDFDICPNYLSGGLMSYDGSHLTPFGAKFFGKKLSGLINTSGEWE